MVKYLFFFFLLISCNSQNKNSDENLYYLNSKAEFDSSLVAHFPRSLSTDSRIVINSKNIDKNDVGFMLIEENVSDTSFDSIVKILDTKEFTKYLSSDECLLIVNSYETIKTYEERTEPELSDKLKIKHDCKKGLLPLPNFIEFNITNSFEFNNEMYLQGFEIYVLESKTGNHFKEYNLQPNPQMPENCKNGYSKGFAIHKLNKTIIYWGVIW
jgi:hypothetical protein